MGSLPVRRVGTDTSRSLLRQSELIRHLSLDTLPNLEQLLVFCQFRLLGELGNAHSEIQLLNVPSDVADVLFAGVVLEEPAIKALSFAVMLCGRFDECPHQVGVLSKLHAVVEVPRLSPVNSICDH